MDILGRRRLWIDNRNFPGRRGLRPEFVAGVAEFIAKARTTDDFRWHGEIRCPCVTCECVKIQDLPTVEIHLYQEGFMPDYYIWYNHGETRESPEFARRSMQAKRARASARGGSLHTGGSVSAATQKMRLEKKEGRSYSIQEMHKIRHTKKDKTKGDIWVDTRSKETYDQATAAIEGHRSSQQSEEGSSNPAPLTAEEETRIWLEVTGGVKKGSAYGMGTIYASETAQSSYLGATIPAPSLSTDPVELARMKAEIESLKQQNDAILQQNAAMRQENKDHQTKMEKLVEKLLGKSEKGKKKKARKEKGKRKYRRRHSSSSESGDESGTGSSSG